MKLKVIIELNHLVIIKFTMLKITESLQTVLQLQILIFIKGLPVIKLKISFKDQHKSKE
jgi:hypothetical protein